MRITPWIAVDRLGLTPSKVRSVRTSWRITHATIGPTIPPRPPARLTPPSTIAATLWSVYGPGTGEPGARRRVDRQTRRTRRTARRSHRPRPWSGRPGRRSGTPPAGCSRGRTCDRPSIDRRRGSQMTSTMTASTQERPRDPRAQERPVDERLEPGRGAAARRVQDEQRRSRPDERHGEGDDDVRHPGHDDERAVDRRRRRARAARTPRTTRIGDAVALVLHQDRRRDARQRHDRADRQVDAARR